MTKERLTMAAPNVREYAHNLAYNLAREQLAGLDDIEKQCLRSGTEYRPTEKAVIISYLNQPYRLSLPDGEVSGMAGGEVPLRDKILILHYFTRAKGTPLSNKMITYQELVEGINYYPTFFKRAIKPIVNHFGSEPEQLLKTAEILGGYQADYGDVAVTIHAFSRVPVTPVLWKGDKEFAPEGNIMFDSTIPDYLPTEDITILSEVIAWRLVRLLKS
jgi:hypothetical protein